MEEDGERLIPVEADGEILILVEVDGEDLQKRKKQKEEAGVNLKLDQVVGETLELLEAEAAGETLELLEADVEADGEILELLEAAAAGRILELLEAAVAGGILQLLVAGVIIRPVPLLGATTKAVLHPGAMIKANPVPGETQILKAAGAITKEDHLIINAAERSAPIQTTVIYFHFKIIFRGLHKHLMQCF